MLILKEVSADQIPIALLLEGDPMIDSIKTYLNTSNCYAAIVKGQVVGACITQQISPKTVELFNISISPDQQQQGIGSRLLAFVLEELTDNDMNTIALGTGSFGYQLAFYQRFGFRVESIIKDFFLERYSEPIYEDGIQHKDMLRLALKLQAKS